MIFMNEWDIAESVVRFARHPVLGPATRFLQCYRDEVNRVSDGWPYWSPPVKAAAHLITLIQRGDASHAEVRRALGPIKAFMTRRGNVAGMVLPTLETSR